MSDARTEGLEMVPTKDFFKPVLVISSPITKEMAEVLNAAWVFDQHGNPQRFEGTLKLAEGELSGATLTLVGKVADPIEIRTEKIAHFSVFKIEDKLFMRIRAHLQDKGVEGLVSIFQFLAGLNKGAYIAQITESQGTLPGTLVGKPKPDENGEYSEDEAARLNVHFKIGRAQKGLKAEVLTLEVDGGWVYGWMCKGEGLRDASDEVKFGGQTLNEDCPIVASENEAIEKAKKGLAIFAMALSRAASKADEKTAVEGLLTWCGEKPVPFDVQPVN